MKRWFLFALLIASLSVAMAKSSSQPWTSGNRTQSQSLDQTWGPDNYGYIAKDSNEPNGPVFGWIDITENGDQVSGLTDDNFVGPFSLGWNFHYYWYDVSQFYIGSNGYIKFSTAGQLAQPIPRLPATSTPNDIVAPWASDWFFGGTDPSECYWWTDGDDTLIVSWVDVTAWAEGGHLGNHDFQLILSRVDSSITFQYGTSTTGDVSNNNISIGIENLTGQIGISTHYSNDTDVTPPPVVYPTNNSAIKFYYPDVVTFQVHDLAVAGVQNARSLGEFILNGNSLDGYLGIRNTGNQNETSYTANYAIRQINNTLITEANINGGAMNAGDLTQTTLGDVWTPSTDGVYRIVGTVTLAGDLFAGNNTLRSELHVVTLPGELAYDDGTSDRPWGWAGGEGGMAMEFVPPVYPCEVISARAYCTTVGPFQLQILDDNGPGGSPGDIIWSADIAAPVDGWNSATVDESEVIINDGSFYVAWYTSNGSGAQFGVDTTSSQGISRRSWEAAGGWAENRLLNEADVMVRATIRIPGQVNHPPVITGATPDPDTLDFLAWNTTQPFAVLAEDPDGQQLNYSWFYDGQAVGTNSATYSHRFIQTNQHSIKCRVCDFEFCDSVQWNINIQISAIEDLPGLLPTEYSIEAYPNPFNPQSTINFALPQQSDARISIFNLAGQEVAVLHDGPLIAGVHSVQWNASDMATGTYFAMLRTPGAERITKLLLLK